MAPLGDILAVVPGWGVLTFLLIGVAFGAVLEQSGFGDSRRLAAQFYFTDMRVLKVMFTAIIVAMLLIFLASGLGMLDVKMLFVNPTYLLPQIVGGLVMGVGFIIGGFCPGTSLVALATFKVDGLFFVLGALTGVYFFGESVSIFPDFFNETFWGVFTLPELFGLSTGWVVLIVVAMAILMFAAAEVAETLIGKRGKPGDLITVFGQRHLRLGALSLLGASLFLIILGQPTLERRWSWMADTEEAKLADRSVHLDPIEVVSVMNDPLLYNLIIDVRDQGDYNLFHLRDARHVPFDTLHDPKAVSWMLAMPSNTVVILTSNGNQRSQEAYRLLKAHGILNLYILDGGINAWLDRFHIDEGVARALTDGVGGEDRLRYRFSQAVGGEVWPANPGGDKSLLSQPFVKKVKVATKKSISGGCD